MKYFYKARKIETSKEGNKYLLTVLTASNQGLLGEYKTLKDLEKSKNLITERIVNNKRVYYKGIICTKFSAVAF